MSLPAIRTAMTSQIAAVAGIAQALRHPPQMAPEIVPCAWLGQATGEIAAHGADLERWTHEIPVTVVVHEKGYVEDELATVENYLEAVVRAFDDAFTLGGTTYGVRFTRYEEGDIVFAASGGPKPYIGFTLAAEVKEKVSRSITG